MSHNGFHSLLHSIHGPQNPLKVDCAAEHAASICGSPRDGENAPACSEASFAFMLCRRAGCVFAKSSCSVGSVCYIPPLENYGLRAGIGRMGWLTSMRKRQPSLHPNSNVVSNAVEVAFGKNGPCPQRCRWHLEKNAAQMAAIGVAAHLPAVHGNAWLDKQLPEPSLALIDNHASHQRRVRRASAPLVEAVRRPSSGGGSDVREAGTDRDGRARRGGGLAAPVLPAATTTRLSLPGL